MKADLTVQQKIIFDNYKKTHPQMSDVEILSALINLGEIELSEDQKTSLFFNLKGEHSNTGLQIEHSDNLTNQPQKTAPLEEELSQRLDKVKSDLEKKKDENVFLRSAWHGIKNFLGFGANSKKVEKALKNEREKISQIKNPEVFMELTGFEYSEENFEKFKNGEILLKSEQALEAYKEGQDGVVEFVGDMFSGILAIGAYSLAVAAAPVTGGLSIAVGFGVAALAGSVVKVGFKAGGALLSGKEYTSKELKHDVLTGGFSGALGPLTGGIGGAVGKSVAARLGIQAIKAGVKDVAVTGAKQGFKQGLKTALINPAGYEYTAGKKLFENGFLKGLKNLFSTKTGLKIVGSYSAEMMTDGALSGALDGGFRAGLDNDWDGKTILSGTVQGGFGGALMAPVMGGGMKFAGKAGHGLGAKIKKFFGWGKNSVSEAAEGVAAKEITKGADEVTPKTKADETVQPKSNVEEHAKTLEGGVKDTELDEVAPFAEHLTEEKHIGDIVLPDKERLEMVNGDFVDGEFVPDGSVTTYEGGKNPLKRKHVTHAGSYPIFNVAENITELSEQIAGIFGTKRVDKYLIKEIDEMLAKHQGIEVSDFSEIIGHLNSIGKAKEFLDNYGFRDITNFRRFEENTRRYAEFIHRLEHADRGTEYRKSDTVIDYSKNIYMNDLVPFLEKIDSKDFEVNIKAYLNMRTYLQELIEPKEFLTTVHDKKFLERIKVLDDFNYKHTDYTGWDNSKVSRFYDFSMLADDKKYTELLERMDCCIKAKEYSKYDAERILHDGYQIERFKKFDSSIPEPVKRCVYTYFKEIFENCPDNIDKFIEFCNKCPERWLKELSDSVFGRQCYCEQRVNLFMNFGALCDHEKLYRAPDANGVLRWTEYKPKKRTPDEIIKRLEILKKVEHLTKLGGEGSVIVDATAIDMIMISGDIKDIDKAITFLNTVDEYYLKKIQLKKENDWNWKRKYDLFELVNNDHIDGMIENARIYNELPEKVRELLARNAGCSDFDINFDIPPEDFKARVDIIKKYGDKLNNNTLLRVFNGEASTKVMAYERFAQLPERLQKRTMEFGYSNYIDCLEILSDDGYKKFIKIMSEMTKDEGFQDILRYLEYNKYIFEELSLDELDTLSPAAFQCEVKLNINEFRRRLQLVPEKLRPYFKDNNELIIYYSSWFDSENSFGQNAQAAMRKLAALSKEDLDILGGQVIAIFIKEAQYSRAGGNILLPKIETLKKIPKGALEILKRDEMTISWLLLNPESNIDIKAATERYNLLVKRGLDSKISSTRLYNVISAGENKYSILKAILDDPNREIENVEYIISCLPSEAAAKRHKDFIFKHLINNPKNRTGDIYSQLGYIFRDEPFDYTKCTPEQLLKYEKEIEFYKKVVTDLIKRDDIHNEQENALLAIMLYALREKNLEIEKAKYESLMRVIDTNGYSKDDIAYLYYVNTANYQVQFNIIEKLILEHKLRCDSIKRIIDSLNDVNCSFAEKLCIDAKLNFPKDIIPDILYSINIDNLELAKLLCTDTKLNFPKDKITNILSVTNFDNFELAKLLCTDTKLNFPKDKIAEILSVTNIDNFELAKLLCTDTKLNFPKDKISKIIEYTNLYNFELAKMLCTDTKLNFPKDKIEFILSCNISSEILPRVIAEKVKKFIDLGFEEDFIRAILQNSESLTFYSDEVLKILSRRQKDNIEIPLQKVIKVLMGTAPDRLADRIDALIMLAKFSDEEVSVFKKYGVDINRKVEELENLINAKHHIISTTIDDARMFLKAVANTDAADDVIRNADFKQFGQDGIRLQYSREDFIKRMNELSGGDFSKVLENSESAEIPKLKMSEEDAVKSKEALEKFKTQYKDKTEEFDVFIDGEETKVTRFCGSQRGGSNEGDFAQIGDKLYYIKFPDESKLEQSVQEVMASELYRAAGIDAPNMKVMFDKEGRILGMASEYIPNVEQAASGRSLFDSFVADAWLADWDAPKHGNSVMRNGRCLKMDVGGSMDYRARGTRKENFGKIVDELTSLIEQNSDYFSMTKADVLASIKHVTDVSDEQVWKIVGNMPAEYRNYTLGQKMIARRDFIKKFEQILEQVDETEFDSILDLMNAAKLRTIREFDTGIDVASLLGYEQTAYGFEGLLNTRDLSKLGLDPSELAKAKKMIKEIEKFTKYNRVADDVPLPKEVKKFLNSILKGIPEFAAYFTKPQHSVQKYSLDIHILKVLQDSLKDPDYAKLGPQDKVVLKFATLLHDIGKRYLGDNTSDTGHAALSAEYVLSILDRFKLTDDIKDRIVSIVENHHWFKAFCTNALNEQTTAVLARRPQDWLIYKIMAKADLINVSEEFAVSRVRGATSMSDIWLAFDKNVANIEAQVQKLREKQVVVTPTRWVEVPERVKPNGEVIAARGFKKRIAKVDGVESEFRYLDLNEIGDDEDMYKYGFSHILKKALRFIVHMPGDGSIKWFNVFKNLSKNPLNNSAQSMSMVSIDNNSTYCRRMFGFVLDTNNANISHAYYSNTGSGSSKGLGHFVTELFEEGYHRSYVKDQFIDFLKKERGIEVNDIEYAKIAEFIMSKKYPEEQLRSEYKIGDKIFRNENLVIDGKTYKLDDIYDAFVFSRDQLINISKQKTHGMHNELVGLNAKIKGLFAKVSSFEELPAYFLRFAKENDLPIIIMKPTD